MLHKAQVCIKETDTKLTLCCWCDLCACCPNINTPNEKLNQHISPSSNQTYINILNMALTSLRTGVPRVKGAVDISQCLSCKVHLQSV